MIVENSIIQYKTLHNGNYNLLMQNYSFRRNLMAK